MSSNEHRHAPRKDCTIPIRFQIFMREYVPAMERAGISSRENRGMTSVRMAMA